jgi:DNA-nicking Smr family endonuclease
MKTIDLHGIFHKDVDDILSKSISETIKKGDKNLKIITGNSDKMKDIVSKRLNKLNLFYQLGDPINPNYILVWFG